MFSLSSLVSTSLLFSCQSSLHFIKHKPWKVYSFFHKLRCSELLTSAITSFCLELNNYSKTFLEEVSENECTETDPQKREMTIETERQLLLLCFSISILLAFTQHTCTGPKLTLTHGSTLIPQTQTDNEFVSYIKNITYPEPLEYETERIDWLCISYVLMTDIIPSLCPLLSLSFFWELRACVSAQKLTADGASALHKHINKVAKKGKNILNEEKYLISDKMKTLRDILRTELFIEAANGVSFMNARKKRRV